MVFSTGTSFEIVRRMPDGTSKPPDERDLRMMEAAEVLYKALKAEREKESCGPGCAGGGWRECSGCDDRIKSALALVDGVKTS